MFSDELDKQYLSPAYQHGHRSHNIFSKPKCLNDFGCSAQLGSGIVLAVLLGGTILYQLPTHGGITGRSQGANRFLNYLYRVLLYLIPAFIIFAIDGWLNPPLFTDLDHLPQTDQQSQQEQGFDQSMHRTSTFTAKSEALQRILGAANPSSIVASVAQAGQRGIASLASNVGGRQDAPPGLGNRDNSCFQNSIIQGLASLRPLPGYLAASIDLPADGNGVSTSKNDGVANVLRQFLEKLNSTDNSGQTLWTPQRLKNMNTWQQQDAQEYFSKLLDEVNRDVAQSAQGAQRKTGFETDMLQDDTAASQHSDDSGYQSVSAVSKPDGITATAESTPVRNPLEGLLAQRVACVVCGYSEGLSLVPFNCLMLSLDNGPDDHDLFDMLDEYVRLESIPDVECPRCTVMRIRETTQRVAVAVEASDDSSQSKHLELLQTRLERLNRAVEENDFDEKTLKECQVTSKQMIASTKTKQAVVARPPGSLAIHVNRSVFDERTFASIKNMANVRFPMIMDLAPWCLGSARGEHMQSSLEISAAGASNDSPNSIPGNRSEHGADITTCGDDTEYWQAHPERSMAAGDTESPCLKGPKYELRAVLTHSGRHDNGHYVCYRKYPLAGKTAVEAGAGQHQPLSAAIESQTTATTQHEGAGVEAPSTNQSLESTNFQAMQESEVSDGSVPGEERKLLKEPQTTDTEAKWWRLSDEFVSEVSEDYVLQQGGVFMLFYDCIDTSSTLIVDENLALRSSEAALSGSANGKVKATGDVIESFLKLPPRIQIKAMSGSDSSNSSEETVTPATSLTAVTTVVDKDIPLVHGEALEQSELS